MAAVSVFSVSQVDIVGSVLHDNDRNASLLVVGSMLNCSGTTFSSSLGTGLVLCNSHAELHNSVFSNNSGGGINSTKSTLTLVGTNTFMNNSADFGGGVSTIESSIYITGNTTFLDNSVRTSGGGVYLERSTWSCNGTMTFAGNIVSASGFSTSVAGTGGGISALDSEINLEGKSTFIDNVAMYGGGLVSFSSIVTIRGSSNFVNNSASYHGGGLVAVAGSDLTLYGNITFTRNIAQQGAGINVQGSSIRCSGYTSLMNNIADVGGGLASYSSIVTMRGSSNFVNNSATLGGGGIAATEGSVLFLNGSITIAHNIAHQGAGINVQESSISCTGYTSLMNNMADYGGGLISWNSIIALRGSNAFMNNVALSDGGGLVSVNSIVTFRGSSNFVNNSATHYGGGIAATEGSDLTLYGSSTIAHNIAQQGAGINVQESSIRCSGYTSFMNNMADYGGGLISWNSTVTLRGDSNFVNNSATHFGGGIVVAAGSDLTLYGSSTFTRNIAQQGAGMNVKESSIRCTGYTSFMNNMADVGGGLASYSSIVTMRGNSNFVNNSATHYGGGIAATEGSDLTLNGSITIAHNIAQEGAGINVQESSISCTGYTSFMRNLADIGGGLVSWYSITTLRGSNTFVNNMALSDGGGLESVNSTITMKGNSSFVNNSADGTGGGVAVAYGTDLNMYGSITFTQNKADLMGGGVFVMDSSIGFNVLVNNLAGNNNTFRRCTFTQNTANYGGGAFMVNSSASFMEKTGFHNNSAVFGGGIHGSRAILEISETVSFTENSATNGGGLSLASGSQCFLSSNTTVYFEANHAEQYGGAIFVTDEPFLYCTRDQPIGALYLTREYCFFQPLDLPNITALFILKNNTAEKAGSTLYGGMVDSCTLYAVEYDPGEVFDALFNIIRNNNTSDELIFSSDPFQVCPCYDGHPNCGQSEVAVTVYPGETFSVPVVAVGQRNGTVPSLIRSSFDENGATIRDLQEAQSANNTCTPLYYTVSSTNPLVTMSLLADGPCLDLGESLQLNIHLKPCPIGFQLSEASEQCICEERLQKYTNSCDIDDLTIDVDGNAWVGSDKTADGAILHSHCPFDYCKSQSVRFTLNETDLQCNYERRGLLCGGCQPGLSLALGSSHCLQCSNAYLSLLVVFALAGIGLVVLLLFCKLTVAVGTINGLLFYANIIAVNQSVFFPSRDTNVVLNILRVFIAWLNLDLGIEICFYDGMDAYTRTWLQFIFPVYVWVLVFTIIILCYYKTWAVRMFGRNPVAVLATLFLLSYAKLLRTIITALSFTFPEYPDGSEVAVWLYDGNVRYLQGKHIPLFLVSMTVLLLLFLPFTLVLSLGQWMQAHSKIRLFSLINDHRVKAFLDAYHGPFRKEHRYWSGLLLVFRTCLFLLFAFNALGNPNVNLLAIIICTAVLTLLTVFTGRIYVNWYLQGLEASFVMNTLIFAATTLYFRSANGNQAALTYTSVGIALVTFTGIIIYHVTIQLKDSCVWRDIIQPKLQRHQRQWVAVPLEDPVADGDSDIAPPHTPTATFIDLRETLLEDSVPGVDENTLAEPERYNVQCHLQPTQTVVNLQQLIREDPANNVLPMIELH